MKSLEEFKDKIKLRDSLDKEIQEFLHSTKTQNKIKQITNDRGNLCLSCINGKLHASIFNKGLTYIINFSELFED